MPLVDFTDSIDPFAPIPQGTYRAEVLKVSERIAGEEAKHPGSPYLAIVPCYRVFGAGRTVSDKAPLDECFYAP
jgi:hypothetical protein